MSVATIQQHQQINDTSTRRNLRAVRFQRLQYVMPAEQASVEVRRKAAREVIDILHEIATLLV